MSRTGTRGVTESQTFKADSHGYNHQHNTKHKTSKKSPLFFPWRRPKKQWYVIPSWSYNRTSPFQIAGAVIPLYPCESAFSLWTVLPQPSQQLMSLTDEQNWDDDDVQKMMMDIVTTKNSSMECSSAWKCLEHANPVWSLHGGCAACDLSLSF